VRRGHISKEGNTLVRWAAIEAIQRQCEPQVQAVKNDLLARRGKTARNIAKVAAARRPPPARCRVLRPARRTRPAADRTGVLERRSMSTPNDVTRTG
jgi:hypothetical protein